MEIAGNNHTTSSLTSINPTPNIDKPSSADYKYNPEFEPKLKETDIEMVEMKKMGEWKDKEGLEELTDLTIGGDIRYALTSKNIDFLKRLRWGCITIGELREITHRINELERSLAENPNLLDGKIVDITA